MCQNTCIQKNRKTSVGIDTKNCSSGIIFTIKTLLIVYCMGELLPVLFKCILKEILSLLSLDETVEKLKFPFSI